MKTKKNNFRLLAFSVFLHLFSCVCACYLDMQKPNGHLSEVNYGCNFFSGWSVQASLITTIYFIYKLFKKSPPNYFDKVFDLIVINANIISISIFTVSVLGGGTAAPRRGGPLNIFSFAVDRKLFGGFYAIIGHYLTPILTIVYFARRKISLARTYFGRRKLFGYSFWHPLFYVAFVLFRPLILGAEKYSFGKSQSGEMKKYPYFFFDLTKHGKSNTFLWTLLVIAIILFGLILFGLSTLFFGWYASHKLDNEREKFSAEQKPNFAESKKKKKTDNLDENNQH